MARPVEWTDKLKEAAITEIIERISEGESVRSIFRDEKESLPSRTEFYNWLSENTLFVDQYTRACDVRSDLIFDEMFEIADDGSNDFMKKQIAEDIEIEVLNTEHIQRSRLRIETRKWALSKMNPKKYGDRIATEHSGEISIIEVKPPNFE